MTTTMTAAEYATDYNAFIEYIDPDGAFVTSVEEFEALPVERREELAQAVLNENK